MPLGSSASSAPLLRRLNVGNGMTALGQFDFAEKLSVPQTRQPHFFGLVIRDNDLHFAGFRS